MNEDNAPLWIVDLGGDDPRKCSAKKMLRFSKALEVASLYKFPLHTLLLDPFSKKAVSVTDRDIIRNVGIGVVDCSWKDAERLLGKKFIHGRYNCRSLPFMLAANPVNWGKPFKLTSLEAFSAALYIAGFKDQAKEILGIYTWGENFIELNLELLERYSSAVDSSEIISIQSQYL